MQDGHVRDWRGGQAVRDSGGGACARLSLGGAVRLREDAPPARHSSLASFSAKGTTGISLSVPVANRSSASWSSPSAA